MTESLTTNGEDAHFRRLLEETKTGQQLEALLTNTFFRRQLFKICRGLTETVADAEDLASEVQLRLCKYFHRFEAQPDKSYGNFFGWVRSIARNLVVSDWRKSIDFGGDRPEDMVDVRDATIDLASNLEAADVVDRFLTWVEALPNRNRRIVEIWIEGALIDDGYSSRKIEEKLFEEGIRCSHVTIGKVIRDVLEAFTDSEASIDSEVFIGPEDIQPIATTVHRKPEQRSGRREKDETSSEHRITYIRKKIIRS